MTATDTLQNLIYEKNPAIQYTKKGGKITIIRPQNHPIQKFCRHYLHMKIPAVSHLHLDAYGSFVFSKINGHRSAAVIGKALANKLPKMTTLFSVSTQIHDNALAVAETYA